MTALGNLITAWLPIALGVVMIGAGTVNFAGSGSIRDSFARWGYPAGFHRLTGGLEVAAGLLLFTSAAARVGAAATLIILIAALITLLRHRDWAHLPGAVVLAVAAAFVVVW